MSNEKLGAEQGRDSQDFVCGNGHTFRGIAHSRFDGPPHHCPECGDETVRAEPAERGRETLQAIAQEIVANASSDLGFKVIWATLDRHFGTGPKQAEQAHHARGAGRELEIRLDEAHRWNAQRVHHVGAPVKDWGIRRIDELEIALAGEPGADTGTTPPRETAWLIERHDMTRTQWLCCDSGEFEWTADPLKPLRLARREDAEQLALLALPNRDDIDVRITEHQWGM